MLSIDAQAITLHGTHYEVGYQLGMIVAQDDIELHDEKMAEHFFCYCS